MALAQQQHEPVVALVNLREEYLWQLKKLNAVLFPIKYRDKDYLHALASGAFSKLAYHGDVCVGSATCRIERAFGGKRLYIMTLGVLAPYRRSGIGSKLMKNILELCEQNCEILGVYLHVQVNNEEALEFYKKFDFKIQETIRNYYKRIDPPDCYLLSKDIVRNKSMQANPT